MDALNARARANEIDALAGRAVDWLAGRPEHADPGLARALRRDARKARALREAAGRPVAVAVFGASQAGKSYLVSRLAAPLGRPLAARFGGTELDFLRDINPPGGQEATGLVTRFTIAAPPAPQDTPIALRLLSQTDVVKILANTFLEDFVMVDAAPPEPEALAAALRALEHDAAPAPQDGMTADDIEDLQDYFTRHFADRALSQALTPAFWAKLADVVPRLPASRRAAAFAPLWGRLEPLTACCAAMLDTLRRLGFARDVHAGLDALQPREHSIIDVRTLFSLGIPGGGTVSMRPASGGAVVAVERAIATGLVTEIVVPLAKRPWPFFDHTDLLDFPGARTREEIPDPGRFLSDPKNPDRLGRVFLRGKVAYLFQRYNAEQEISAMLLCVGPSNQDVQTLPRMVDDWIGLTAGATAAERAGRACNLFLVLTKFDMEFEEKGGEDLASVQRWTTRMQASLTDFFGKAYSWPNEWVPGRAFDNSFWLRNPSVGFGAVFDYAPSAMRGEPAVEIGVASRAEAAVRERQGAYLGAELVRRHFADPQRAWDEALRPNDGGISHLAASLAPVCDPSLKARQVMARGEILAAEIAGRLRPFHHGGDAAERVQQAQLRAKALVPALVACAQAQMMGPLLRALMVETERVGAVYWRQQNDASAGTALLGTSAGDDDYGGLLGDLLGAPAAADAPRDAFDQLALLAVEDWEDHVRELAEDESAPAAFVLPRDALQALASELSQAARRLALAARIAEALRTRAGFQGRANATEAKQVAIVEEMLNRFVQCQGWEVVEPARRPRSPRGDRPVFLARPPGSAPPDLPERPTPYDLEFNTDWLLGLARLMEDNARSLDGANFDIAANAALGKILDGLRKGQPA
jgi:hypothetical protein